MTSHDTLATKLETLIREHYASRGEKVPGTAAIAKDIRDRTGLRISTGTLHKLRTGQTDVPTGNRLRALAEFFGRPMAFFLDREASNDDMDLAVALRDKGVRAIALRSADLSERSRRAILDMIDRAREIERLDSPRPEQLDESDPAD